MVRKLILGLACGLTMTAGAAADGFGGGYIGAFVGGDQLNLDIESIDGPSAAFDDTGVVYGGLIGFGLELGPFLAQAEGFISGTEASLNFDPDNILAEDAVLSSNFNYGFYVNGGIVLFDRLAAFASAGYGRTNFDIADESEGEGGVLVGAGLELRILGGIAARARYTRQFYGTEGLDDVDLSSDFFRNEFSFGIILHF